MPIKQVHMFTSESRPGRVFLVVYIRLYPPMLDISLSCSLSDSMLEHSVSTIVSTWYSFTLPTSGPKLSQNKQILTTQPN